MMPDHQDVPAFTGDEPRPANDLHWVAVYLVSQTFGSAAEGGWWFDSGEIVTDPAVYAQLRVLPAAFLTD